MLAAAGLSFVVQPSGVDEVALRATFEPERRLDEDFPIDVAEMLAGAKASDVSQRRPGTLVIGADQVLVLKSERCMRVGQSDYKASSYELFEKPASLEAARAQLRTLRGRSHQLFSAAALAEDGEVVWSHVEAAELTMRDFSDAFLDRHLNEVGARVCDSVGAYELEGLGVQLFESVVGDYFTILGLPLLPLLEWLRGAGVLRR
jgi:septum formation protein